MSKLRFARGQSQSFAPPENYQFAVIGNGAVSLLTTARLLALGYSVALINPAPEFDAADLEAFDGFCLWRHAYRHPESAAKGLPRLWEELNSRWRDLFPLAVGQTALKKADHWSIVSSVPWHTVFSDEVSESIFRLEKRAWAAPYLRVITPELLEIRMKKFGLGLKNVANVDQVFQRGFMVYWDSVAILRDLLEFFKERQESQSLKIFQGARALQRTARRLRFAHDGKNQEIVFDRRCLVLLTGDLLPRMKNFLKTEADLSEGSSETWIQSLRKRRIERHRLFFQRPEFQIDQEGFAFSLGPAQYIMGSRGFAARWSTGKGPDQVEVIVDEVVRMDKDQRFPLSCMFHKRCFHLDWEWKNPQWRSFLPEVHYGTAFEGDLWSVPEIVSAIPT